MNVNCTICIVIQNWQAIERDNYSRSSINIYIIYIYMQQNKSFCLSVGDFWGVLFKLEILLVFLCGKKVARQLMRSYQK